MRICSLILEKLLEKKVNEELNVSKIPKVYATNIIFYKDVDKIKINIQMRYSVYLCHSNFTRYVRL